MQSGACNVVDRSSGPARRGCGSAVAIQIQPADPRDGDAQPMDLRATRPLGAHVLACVDRVFV